METLEERHAERGSRAWQAYERLKGELETPDRIGKFFVVDPETGDYEVDETGIEGSHRLQRRHPGVRPFLLRIGYRTAESFAGMRERTQQ